MGAFLKFEPETQSCINEYSRVFYRKMKASSSKAGEVQDLEIFVVMIVLETWNVGVDCSYHRITL